jgi:hypothetical protein
MRLDIDRQRVAAGAHDRPEDGMCVMEMVAYVAGEQHSDHPQCVSPVIATFMRTWNDGLGDRDRQMENLQESAMALVERMAWLKDDPST